jgi:polysaccharide export outer membrane protein
MKHVPRLFVIGLSLCFVWGQQRPAPTAPVFANENSLPPEKLAPDDLVAVSVYDAPELTTKVRIGKDGDLRLPLLRKPIKATGLMPTELEVAIATALRDEGVLVRPVVTVVALQYTSRPISVIGSVKHPLTFDASGTVTLLSALTRAEGLTQDAGSEILISRRGTGTSQDAPPAVQRIPVKRLIEQGEPTANVRLYGGEEVRVPPAPKIFVLGNVRKPGAYAVQDNSGTSLLKILALSEGLLPFSSKQAYIYRVQADSTVKTEVPVELQRIIQRKAQDVTLVADDILYVPDNKGKRLTAQTLDRIASFGASTGSGLLIFH